MFYWQDIRISEVQINEIGKKKKKKMANKSGLCVYELSKEELEEKLIEIKELTGTFVNDDDLKAHLNKYRGRVTWAMNSFCREQVCADLKNPATFVSLQPLVKKLNLYYSDNNLNRMDVCEKKLCKFEEGLESQFFPEEILIRIFSYLDVKGVVNSSFVCKQWHRVSNDCIIWKKLISLKWKYLKDHDIQKYVFFIFELIFFYLFHYLSKFLTFHNQINKNKQQLIRGINKCMSNIMQMKLNIVVLGIK